MNGLVNGVWTAPVLLVAVVNVNTVWFKVAVNSSLFNLIEDLTNAVVAIWVVFVSTVAVGACGIFVNMGDDIGAAPKFVNAAAAVVAPVPPFAIATVPVTLPAVVAVVALPVRFPVTLPVKLAVMVPAEKLPLASLFTIVLTVLLFVAAFTLVFKEVILKY